MKIQCSPVQEAPQSAPSAEDIARNWLIVPMEPTPFMLGAMNLCARCHESARESYRAALEASQDGLNPSSLFKAALDDAARWYFIQHHLTDCGIDVDGTYISYRISQGHPRRDVSGATIKDAIDIAMAEAKKILTEGDGRETAAPNHGTEPDHRCGEIAPYVRRELAPRSDPAYAGATVRLRFAAQPYTTTRPPVLQQWFEIGGRGEWRDVPLVVEERPAQNTEKPD